MRQALDTGTRGFPVLSEAGEPSIRWDAPILKLILASTLLGVMGVSLVSPALPAVRDALGIGPTDASWILSAFTLPGILLSPLVGTLADRHGRRAVLAPSAIAYGIAGGGVLLAPNLATVVALRFVQGIAAAGLLTMALTLIGDRFDGDQRAEVMGVNGAALVFGIASYPLLGGALSTVSWRAPFALYLVAIPVGLVALRIVDEPDRASSSEGGLLDGLDALPLGPLFILYTVAGLVFLLLYGGVLTTIPFLVDRTLGLGPRSIGLLLGIQAPATVLAVAALRWLRPRTSPRVLIQVGLGANAAALVGLSLATETWSIAASLAVFGVGMGFAIPSVDTAISQLAPDRHRGAAMSLHTTVVRTGQTIGPLAFTVAAVQIGGRSTLLVAGIAGLVLVLVAVLVGWARSHGARSAA